MTVLNASARGALFVRQEVLSTQVFLELAALDGIGLPVAIDRDVGIGRVVGAVIEVDVLQGGHQTLKTWESSSPPPSSCCFSLMSFLRMSSSAVMARNPTLISRARSF